MRIDYTPESLDDATRQFRYYLVVLDRPEVALRFKQALRETADFLANWPEIAPLYNPRDSRFKNIRSWPVRGFKNLRLYFRLEDESVRVIRILHGKRNVRKILTATGIS